MIGALWASSDELSVGCQTMVLTTRSGCLPFCYNNHQNIPGASMESEYPLQSEHPIHALRLQRLSHCCGAVQLVGGATALSSDLIDRPWITVTCSRLGTDVRLHGEVCRFLARSMLDCRVGHGVLLVAEGSAAQPWALRAAELFGVDVIRVNVDGGKIRDNAARIFCRSDDPGALTRDAAVIALSDRVDAAYVRPDGTIAKCLQRRLGYQRDASTRVAVISSRKSAARELIHQGAIGWYVRATSQPCDNDVHQELDAAKPADIDAPEPADIDAAKPAGIVDPDWMRSDGQWLVHCTRACRGPWPGQTTHQHQDSLLLSPEEVGERTPLVSLNRILRSQRLVACAIASAKQWPVVCFSEAPLRELLDQRCYRPHLKRWDYEPYGVAIRKRVAIEVGIQPVIYGNPENRGQFEDQDQFRFQSIGHTYDWRRECEWRSPGDIDLDRLNQADLKVFVPSLGEATKLAGTFNRPVDVVTATSQRQNRQNAPRVNQS
jgi:hypothetical protein